MEDPVKNLEDRKPERAKWYPEKYGRDHKINNRRPSSAI
jgi:hypothetical protein